MDYYEFCEKSGWDISEDDYDRYVLPAYMKGPSDVVGIEVTLFCEWLNDNGITLKQLKAIVPIISDFDEAVTNMQALQQKVRDLEAEIMTSRTNEDAVEARLRAIVRCFGEDTIVERMAEDIPADMIIDAYIRAKAVKQ